MNVFVFHQDLRLVDNTTLITMCRAEAGGILPVFVLDPQQVSPERNPFFGHPSVQFMCESLRSLDSDVRACNPRSGLCILRGGLEQSLEELRRLLGGLNSVGFNAGYSPFALRRDGAVKDWCARAGCKIYCEEDLLLLPAEESVKGDGTPFQVFTPFRNACWKKPVRRVDRFRHFRFVDTPGALRSNSVGELRGLYEELPGLLVRGGRTAGLRRLRALSGFADYGAMRDTLSYQTTLLGAYLSFGVLSIREVVHKVRAELGSRSALESELWWREFYFMVMYRFPRVIGGCFKPKWDRARWPTPRAAAVTLVREARTGFPVVDAGLRQLYQTGWSHNRLRMIITSFLCKDLLLDPRWVEQFWARHLVDYSVSATNGGVSWVVGYGTDAMLAQRVFNPWLQGQKFDRDCVFIKRWVPELASLAPRIIHQWYAHHGAGSADYPPPCVDHKQRREQFLRFVARVR